MPCSYFLMRTIISSIALHIGKMAHFHLHRVELLLQMPNRNFTYLCQILLVLSTAGTISLCFYSFEQEKFDA